MDVICTFKMKKDSQNLEYGYIKDQCPQINQDQDAQPSQEPPASSKAPHQDLEDMDVLHTFNIKIESQNWEQGCVKDQVPHPNQDKIAKTQSGTSSIFQSPKTGLLGHGCRLGLQIQDREPKF